MAKSHTQNPNHTTLNGEDVLDQYVLSHSDDEPAYLHQLYRATNIHMLHGRMASGHLQGRLLKMLVMMMRPRHIIEVGTFSGYSALCMAEGLAELDNAGTMANNGNSNGHGNDGNANDGHLWTFEINDEQEPFTRKWIEGSPWADRVTFLIGDAIKEAPRIAREIIKGEAQEITQKIEDGEAQEMAFDMAFLDGDKRTYIETYEALMPLMNHGAYILADNTLWDGHVIDPDYDRDNQTRGIRAFNDHVKQDNRVTRVILPLRDGLTIIRKK